MRQWRRRPRLVPEHATPPPACVWLLSASGGDGPRDLRPEVVVLLASSAQSGVLQDTPQHVAAVQQTISPASRG